MPSAAYKTRVRGVGSGLLGSLCCPRLNQMAESAVLATVGCQNGFVAKVIARATKQVGAAPERVLAFLRDYDKSRPRILPGNYSAYRVEAGGEGDGSVIAYHFAAGGRERDYRLRVEEADGALLERDELSSFVSHWTVEPSSSGSTVTIESSWDGATGIAGIFEGFFAPLGLRRIYGELLDKLAVELSS